MRLVDPPWDVMMMGPWLHRAGPHRFQANLKSSGEIYLAKDDEKIGFQSQVIQAVTFLSPINLSIRSLNHLKKGTN